MQPRDILRIALPLLAAMPLSAHASEADRASTDQTLMVSAEDQEYSRDGGSLRSARIEYKYDFGDTTVLVSGVYGERRGGGVSHDAAGGGVTLYHDFSPKISASTSVFLSENEPVFARVDIAQDLTVRVADKTTLTLGGRWAQYSGGREVVFASAGLRRYFRGGSLSYRASLVDPDGTSSFVAHLINLTINDGRGGGKTQIWLGAGASSLERNTIDGDFTGRDYSATLRRYQPIGGNLDLVLTGGVTSYARPFGRVTGMTLGLGLLVDLDGGRPETVPIAAK